MGSLWQACGKYRAFAAQWHRENGRRPWIGVGVRLTEVLVRRAGSDWQTEWNWMG